MQDQAEGEPVSRTYFGDSVPKGRAAAASVGAKFVGEHHEITAFERDDVCDALTSRLPFHEHELTAGEISAPAQEHGPLERKRDLAVRVLMERVIVARAVAQHSGVGRS